MRWIAIGMRDPKLIVEVFGRGRRRGRWLWAGAALGRGLSSGLGSARGARCVWRVVCAPASCSPIPCTRSRSWSCMPDAAPADRAAKKSFAARVGASHGPPTVEQ